MKLKVIVSIFLLTSLFTGVTNAAYQEVSCSTDTVFGENSCNQCFLGGEQKTGANIGLLSDTWINSGETSLILYKEDQDLPRMISLNGASWNQIPDSKGFWNYTDSLEALYDEDEAGYVLNSGQSVDWLEGKLDSAYNLAENNTAKGTNIGLLIYPITTHVLDDAGNVEVDGDIHNECVLFKSAEAVAPLKKEQTKQLPQTGPENFILVLLAMLLAFGVFKLVRRA